MQSQTQFCLSSVYPFRPAPKPWFGYNFEWKYTKDGSVNRNDDCAYLDDVEYHSNAIPGDSDGDGTVTVSDALLAMRYAMGTVTNINVNAADVDGDGNVTITDAVTILRMAMTA